MQLEAMACRKPVISTNLPTGVSWVNQNGKTGYVVPPGDIEELAKAIQKLIGNPRLRDGMGEAGRSRVEQDFTSTKMAEAMLLVYEEMLNQPHRATVAATLPHAATEEVVAGSAKWAEQPAGTVN